jgi:hypothetical protein
MELTKASDQWMKRPADERFKSLEALHGHCLGERTLSRSTPVATRALLAVASGSEVQLANTERPNAPAARLTNWAFSQLSTRIGAPAGFLRDLKPETAATVINERMHAADVEHESCVLVKSPVVEGDPLTVRALTTDSYTRIWNADITSRLLELERRGPWQPAPAAFDETRGLYAGDRDCFAFMVDSGRRIFERDPGGGLSRGFFVWNSEVGAASFGMLTFLYEYVCGNHIVWGASKVKELRLRHVGNVDQRAWGALAAELRTYAESSASDEEAKIESTRRYSLGTDKDTVLDTIFGLRIPALTKAKASEALQIAVEREDRYGSPYSAWGFANGVTELSQREVNAGARVELDRAGGKILELAF